MGGIRFDDLGRGYTESVEERLLLADGGSGSDDDSDGNECKFLPEGGDLFYLESDSDVFVLSFSGNW